MNSGPSAREIKEMLLPRMADLCGRLFPDGRIESGQWVARGPQTGPKQTPKLKVRLSGGIIGAWIDYQNSVSGDALGLIAYALTGTAKAHREAIVFAKDFLGLARMDRAQFQAMKDDAGAAAAEHAAAAERDLLKRIAAAVKLFENVAETGAARLWVKRYLGARGIDIDAFNFVAENFRASPATEYWKGAEWRVEDGRRIKTKKGPDFPALHSAMRQWNGVITACHVTFLDPFKPGKAPVTPAKLMLGQALGAVIEVSCGKPFWRDEEPRAVILAEGLETAMSLAQALPDFRVWACGSLAGIGHAPVQLPCVSRIIFARDNNDGNAQAQAGFDKAFAMLGAHGKPLDVVASHVGDDFNDAVTGEI